VVGCLSVFYSHILFTINPDTRVTRLIDVLCFVVFVLRWLQGLVWVRLEFVVTQLRE
jgi:hypothetical protein